LFVCGGGFNHTAAGPSTGLGAQCSGGIVLEAEGLAAFRGERLVFAAVGFAVPAGGALLVTGPNGSGKSTLLRVLAGLCRAEAGRLAWDGADALADLPTHAARLRYLGHQDAVKPGLTVAENLRFWGGAAAIGTALESVGLAALSDLPARMLSAGQKRRLAIARLALAPRPLWLLDEPTLGLDAASIGCFGALVAAQRAQGGMVIAATHLPLPFPDAATLALGATPLPRGEGENENPLPLREGAGGGVAP
jgi:heme exporter protein A